MSIQSICALKQSMCRCEIKFTRTLQGMLHLRKLIIHEVIDQLHKNCETYGFPVKCLFENMVCRFANVVSSVMFDLSWSRRFINNLCFQINF